MQSSLIRVVFYSLLDVHLGRAKAQLGGRLRQTVMRRTQTVHGHRRHSVAVSVATRHASSVIARYVDRRRLRSTEYGGLLGRSEEHTSELQSR